MRLPPSSSFRWKTGLPSDERADFTVFDLVDSDIEATDSNGDVSVLKKLFEPRYAVIGSEAIAASRYIPRARRLVRHSHGYSYR